jgi:hypothetical protein
VSDEEMLLRMEVLEEEIAAMRAAGPPGEYPRADQPLVTLVRELAQRADRTFIGVQKGDISITLARSPASSQVATRSAP